ncbi:hypothetical protein DL98DRAFT_600958 [Cadophora sp. DSE1049]|nr:hypothetical protein DL98DRAFT_600958 [Cadophora sp. DSE1049]
MTSQTTESPENDLKGSLSEILTESGAEDFTPKAADVVTTAESPHTTPYAWESGEESDGDYFTPNVSPPAAPASFTLFTKLVPELQTMVWKEALADLPGRSVTTERCQPSVPALLQTCTEARYQDLKLYTRQTFSDPDSNEVPPFIIFIDFERDTLMLSARKTLN